MSTPKAATTTTNVNANIPDITESSTIYVGNLDPRITKLDLYELFIQFGKIYKINYPRDKISENYQGFAFVEFQSAKDSNYVLSLFQNNNQNNYNNQLSISLYGKPIKIRPQNNQLKDKKNNQQFILKKNNNTQVDVNLLPVAKLFLKGLDDTVDLNQLKIIFNKFGELVKDPELVPLKSNAQMVGIYIYFRSYTDSDNAIKSLNKKFIFNKQIQLEYAFKNSVSDTISTASKKQTRYGDEIDRVLNVEAIKNGLL
ncbi:hypothetical protein TBLA_0B02730 [Henningerozyma blattae CBS 6284]|uniref:RRM domain-containing protein n=1 Tax=Henningerozyma blattae (strain ATCC 34711 / CBS 6284 / DSM 70876 / NBRC 10599 / NRRL Y-10934 / UCD 77-7) TaxID=1071380 RepID=I2GYB3_HENB6|nr:hypothetical protein TBLA_0B02730 [Tetrapisispora blattae CBS 6284]CCH59115.1 hypothetical protein TBLA_0B02730 [Tetrapisispora blattae CBS 6284]